MLNINQIDNALKVLAVNNRYRFNAQQVAYLSNNEDIEAVYEYLVSREPYVLNRRFEVLCPKNLDSHKSYSSIKEIPKEWVECRVCGEEFIPSENLIHIVFSFTPTYLKQLEEEKTLEKKMNRSLEIAY